MIEEGRKSSYSIKVLTEVFTNGLIHGLDPEDMLEFFASQVETMLLCPPNYRMWGKSARVWILRGFYPDTPIFFKLVVIDTSIDSPENHGTKYFAKVTPLRTLYRTKHGGKYDDHYTWMSEGIEENMTNRMENTFFHAKHEIKKLITKKLTMPRCMAPKGMKLLRFKRPRKAKKREAKKS